MIGHHDVDASLREVAHLITSGNAVVDRDDERWRARLDHAVEGLTGQAVAFVESMRYEGLDTRTERAQSLGEQAGGRDAVDVEVAEHGDGLAAPHRPLHTIRHLGHAGDDKGIRPVPFQRGSEEQATLLNRADPMGDHDARHERRHVQPRGELALKLEIACRHAPVMSRLKRCHGHPPFPKKGGTNGWGRLQRMRGRCGSRST